MGVKFILFKKILRDLRKNWKQFLSVILIAGLAITIFSGLMANYKLFKEKIDNVNNLCNTPDIWCVASNVTEDDVSNIKDLKDVTKVEERFQFDGTFKTGKVNVFVADDDSTMSIPIIEGGTRGVVVDLGFAKKNDIKVGDKVSFSPNLPDLVSMLPENMKAFSDKIQTVLSNLSLSVTVTGLMYHAEMVEEASTKALYVDYSVYKDFFLDVILANAESPMILGMEREDVYTLFKSMIDYKNQILIETSANSDAVRQTVVDYYDTASENVLLFSYTRVNHPMNKTLYNDANQAEQMTYAFPMIFLVVSILVIITTLTQLIIRERTQIGTMKALGMSKTMISIHYISFGMFLCGLGSIVGAIAGPLIIPSVMGNKYNMLYTLPDLKYSVIPVVEILLAIVCLLVIAGFVSYLVLRKCLNEKPAECMRPVPPKIKASKFSTKRKNESFRRFIATKMAFRNIKANITRAFMVIAGVTGCVALLCCGFGITDTINNSIDRELVELLDYDIALTYNYSDENYIDNLSDLRLMKSHETYKTYSIKAQGKNVKETLLHVIRPHSDFINIDLAEDEIAVAKDSAEELGVKIGDDITYSVGSKIISGKVSKIVETSMTKGLFVAKDLFNTYHSAGMWVKVNDGINMQEVSKIFQQNESTLTCYTISDMEGKVEEAMGSINIMVNTLKIFALLLAIVVLVNLALLNLKERTRDIATMKVLGFSKFEIGRSLLIEIMFLTIIGVALGLLLGFPTTKFVLSVNENTFISYIYAVKPMSYVISGVIGVFAALILNLLTNLVIGKIKMVESLKSIE